MYFGRGTINCCDDDNNNGDSDDDNDDSDSVIKQNVVSRSQLNECVDEREIKHLIN